MTVLRARSALAGALALAGAGAVAWGVSTLDSTHAAGERVQQPLVSDGSFVPVQLPAQSSSAVVTGTTGTAAASSASATGGAGLRQAGMDPAGRAMRPGEQDVGLHVLAGGHEDELPDASHDSPAWSAVLAGAGPEQDVPQTVAQAWECHDGEADTDAGQLDWEKASRISGALVLVPSVCLASPMTSSGVAAGTNQLQLPVLPWSTWYEESAPPAAGAGNTYVASHLNTRKDQQIGPFKQLEAVPMGAPVIVRDEQGTYTVFTVEEQFTALQTDMAEDPALREKLFRADGEHTLSLITCVKGASGHYDTNRVVFARAQGGVR